MKTKLIFFAYLLIPHFLMARTATALTDAASPGNWADASTWAGGFVPANADTVIIPADKAVVINTVIYSSVTPPSLVIQVRGILRFEPPGKLHLASSGSLHVFFGGSIVPKNGASSQLITIGGIIKYNAANDGVITGPSYADILSGASVAGSLLGGFMPWVLPVKWSEFVGRQTKDGILLQWKMMEDWGADRFQLEKSIDGGGHWRIIHDFMAKDVAASFVDRDPSNDLLLYRLKAVGRNGQVYYSSIIKIVVEPGVELKVFPNPSSGSFQLTVSGVVKGEYTVSLVDPAGQVITRKEIRDTQTTSCFNLKGLVKGAYFIRLTDGSHLVGNHAIIIQ